MNAGEEYLHLPAIVEAAESSPAATSEATTKIRKLLGKDNYMRAYAQYNAIMLIRILTDNPGRSFTRNFDSKFVSTVKELLREGKDMSVQQILRETLDNYEVEKVGNNETLEPIVEMWKKEKAKQEKKGNGPVSDLRQLFTIIGHFHLTFCSRLYVCLVPLLSANLILRGIIATVVYHHQTSLRRASRKPRRPQGC